MKMKMICIFFLLFTCLAYSQTVDEIVNGPIKGYTFIPKPQTIFVAVAFSSRSATSKWDSDGEEISYNYLFDGEADPELFFKNLLITCGYTLSNKFGFYLRMPVIVEQKLEANAAAGYEQYYQDFSGQTGIGDISIGGMYLVSKSKQQRIELGADYQFASGTSPDNIGENDLSSTGSGHTSFNLSLTSDIMLNPIILLSAGVDYKINNEATFTQEGYSWDEKQGNQFSSYGKLTSKVSDHVGIGVNAVYSYAVDSKIEGEVIDDTHRGMFSISPMIGYKVSSNYYSIDFYMSYRLEIAGVNYAKANGIMVGMSIYK